MNSCFTAVAIPKAHLHNWRRGWGWGWGKPDRLLTPLHFQDAEMHRTAQAEHMEVQKRGNHGTLSAQLHNEKSNPLVVSILHVMCRGPVAEPPRPRSAQLSLPACKTPRLGQFVTEKQPEAKQLINIRRELIQKYGKLCVITSPPSPPPGKKKKKKDLISNHSRLHRCSADDVNFVSIGRRNSFTVKHFKRLTNKEKHI